MNERADGRRLGPGGDLNITIAMLTFRRNHLLTDGITALADACKPYPNAELLIVDNDPDGGALGIVDDAAKGLSPLHVRYLHEPQAGIAAARNRALDGARGEVLVFIDDDERPTAGWLEKLMGMYCAKSPTAVIGPVRHEFEVTPDPWILAGEFFQRRRERNGALIGEGASNNMLLDLQEIRELQTRFDDRLGLTGGEDSLFTKQLVKRGGRIVWCDDAEVVDLVPPSRISRQWVLRRAFRLGNTPPRVDLMMADTAWQRSAVRARHATRGAARVGIGSLRSGWGALSRNRRHRARGARTAARGAGMIAGAIGYRYTEYARGAVPTRQASTVTSSSRDDVVDVAE